MKHTILFLSILAMATGCSKELDKPEGDLSEVLRLVFRDGNPTDEATEDLLKGALARLDEDEFPRYDLNASVNDRTVSPDKLTADYRGGFELPPGMTGDKFDNCTGDDPSGDCAEVSEDNQLPVGVFGISKHGLEANMTALSEDNQACIASNTSKYSMKTWENKDCFFDGSCNSASSVSEVRTESLIANVWLDIHNDYFRTELPDGREVVLSRGWTEKVWWSDKCTQSWDQRFTIDIWIPDADDAGKTKRLFVMWSSVNITGVSEKFYTGLVKDGSAEGMDNTDAFIDGETCNWRDTPNTRSEDVDAQCATGGGA
ncbi:MAG: hypothetical protein ACI9MC_001840 [Kiritimatiellia bacterium]|jgi:hypothetical protein